MLFGKIRGNLIEQIRWSLTKKIVVHVFLRSDFESDAVLNRTTSYRITVLRENGI